jgi:uncharacterized membrane protein SirB2
MLSLYPWLKNIHVSTVILSGLLFLLRYLWMAQDSLGQRGRWVRVVPHVNDSLLLISGITMATLIKQYPLVDGWLTAKLLALLCYIVIGSIALKRGRTRRLRIWSGPLAIVCYLYILAVALSRSPIPDLDLILLRLSV